MLIFERVFLSHFVPQKLCPICAMAGLMFFGLTSAYGAGVTVSGVGNAGQTTELGGIGGFSVVLFDPPTANVVFSIMSSDTTEGRVSTGSLNFTTANWNVPQVVTITGVDDALVDGDVSYTIIIGDGVSSDPAYDGQPAPTVNATNHATPETDTPSPTFLDVDAAHPQFMEIEFLSRQGIALGCDASNFCPNEIITRDAAAIWLISARFGMDYMPPAADGNAFTDVAAADFGADWIEQMEMDGITDGCDTGLYCPTQALTKEQAALLILKSKRGGTYSPSASTTPIFSDVPAGSFAIDYIEELFNSNYADGCNASSTFYCPKEALTKAGLAGMIGRMLSYP